MLERIFVFVAFIIGISTLMFFREQTLTALLVMFVLVLLAGLFSEEKVSE